ncbi:MAG: MmcQ/YjbR family DNA-binding protein [Cyanobacteria bacterium SZAS LIN-3]|nr:MmcQ/YjbR family DNA-binding protein [Cyanobacteria bacterium SZAS LIN-3]MBS2009073.1 MmcQ/YjbR family DNA-binding protein [Cyanobacteria bacterium SZAS TMP-1]
MNRQQFNKFCQSLPQTTHVVQWGDCDVWKIGEKVFAIGGWNDTGKSDPVLAVTFKVSDMAFEILSERPGCRPAPYLASRGLKWIQHYDKRGLSDAELKGCIERSYTMIARALSKKKQMQLGLNLVEEKESL